MSEQPDERLSSNGDKEETSTTITTTTTTTTTGNNLREDGGGDGGGASDLATDTSADGEREESRVHSKSMKTVPSKWRQKSKSNLKRKSYVDETVKSATVETQIEQIFTPVVGLDDLRDCYYRDLRELLPPPPTDLLHAAAAECAVDVDARLREMHDAVDEIDRALLPLTLLLKTPSSSSSSVCDKAKHAAHQTLPRRARLRKPNVEGRPKIYRIEEKALDWTTARWCDVDKRPPWTGAAAELRTDDDSSTMSSAVSSSTGGAIKE